MPIWSAELMVLRPLPSLPRPFRVEMEVKCDPSYYCQGRLRAREHFSIFVYTLQGQGGFRYGDREYPVPPQQGFLCRVNDPKVIYYYPPQLKKPWKFIWTGFAGKASNLMVRDIVERFGSIFAVPLSADIIQSLLSYRRYDGLTCEVSPADGADLVMDLLLTLQRSSQEAPADQTQALAIREARGLIEKRLDRKITVSEIARELNLSREHLSRLFLKHTGSTLHDYILRRKIRLACLWLRETQLSAKQIAFRLGFDQPGNFSRAFKKLLQLTPSQFKHSSSPPLLG